MRFFGDDMLLKVVIFQPDQAEAHKVNALVLAAIQSPSPFMTNASAPSERR